MVGLIAASSVVGLAGAAPAAGRAASGQVVIFTSEFQPLDVFKDPTGCHQLPIAAHVLVNQTDQTVKVYQFPGCAGPEQHVVKPGYGTHVTFGSFSV